MELLAGFAPSEGRKAVRIPERKRGRPVRYTHRIARAPEGPLLFQRGEGDSTYLQRRGVPTRKPFSNLENRESRPFLVIQ